MGSRGRGLVMREEDKWEECIEDTPTGLIVDFPLHVIPDWVTQVSLQTLQQLLST